MKAHNRIAPRYLFESAIQIRVSRNGVNLIARAWARDLSETGLMAFVAEEFEVGELVMLIIKFPSCKDEQVPARVARQVGTKYGFQFTALSLRQRVAIRAITKGQPLVQD